MPEVDPEGALMGVTLTFEAFFEEHRSRLFGALCLVTGDRNEAEEICQDAFLKLWERWEQVSQMEDPAGYLFRTAMNVFRNRARRTALVLKKALRLVPSTDDLAAVENRDEMSLPTAQTSLDETALTLASQFTVPGFGLGTYDQDVPSQCRASVSQ